MLKPIPIVVLTTSQAEDDIESSYRLQANCYVSKPAQWDEFTSLMKTIVDLWRGRGKAARIWRIW
jgi:two-component system, chemotaxis family, response regulator Rcp1